MPSKVPYLLRQTAKAAMTFNKRRLWEEFTNGDLIALEVPTEDHPLIASIMGGGGEEYGLALFRGPGAARCVKAMMESDGTDPELADEASQIAFSMEKLGNFPPEWRKPLKKAGFSGHTKQAPFFLAKEPGRRPRMIDQKEAETFLYALKGILKAYDSKLLIQKPLGQSGEVPVLTLSGDPLDPEISVRRDFLRDVATENVVSPVPAPESLADLPLLDKHWLVGLPVLPFSIADDDRTVRALFVVEENSEFIMQLDPSMGRDIDGTAGKLFDVFEGQNAAKVKGVPRKITFSSRSLFNAVSPELGALGVHCSIEPRIPLLEKTVREMITHVDSSGGRSSGFDLDDTAEETVDDA